LRLITVQRSNSVIVKSLNESRIKANLDIFHLEKKDFDSIERIPWLEGQKRYGDWDELWGTDLFAGETLDLASET
jgi:diketogulonate reductase-like aldo/keto reductase